MAKFIVLLLCLAAIQASSALKCKKCTDCEKTTAIDEDCSPSSAEELGCLTEVYKDAAKKEITEKKCVRFPKGGNYECPKQSGIEAVSCKTCKTDFCNSAQSISLNLIGFIGIVLAYLVPKVILN